MIINIIDLVEIYKFCSTFGIFLNINSVFHINSILRIK